MRSCKSSGRLLRLVVEELVDCANGFVYRNIGNFFLIHCSNISCFFCLPIAYLTIPYDSYWRSAGFSIDSIYIIEKKKIYTKFFFF